MWRARTNLRKVYKALDEAETYAEWLAAAEEHDHLTGAEQWRNEDSSIHYDADALRDGIQTWQLLRRQDRPLELAEVLTQDLYRHLNDLATPDLYDTALAGPKRLVESYLTEAEDALNWLADSSMPAVPDALRLQRFETAWKVFGRTALSLSGGATLGFHHLGVCKALFDHGLLPHILSGASTGAMIAAGICTRSDDEIAEMYEDLDQLRLDGLKAVGLLDALKAGAVLDPTQLYDVLRHNVGAYTFAEAFSRSGRALNISVSPTRTRQKPRMLCHLTSPDVLVASAALASSALPGLFPPVVLIARQRDGDIAPYVPSERWVDGSLYEDLPKLRMSRLHNVNHFIVSQTNPHVLPFVRHHDRRGLVPAVGGLLSATVRQQGVLATDLLRRLNAARDTTAGQAVDRAYALFTQDYGGDIDIHPQFSWRLYRKVVVNPTPEDLRAFVLNGERSVWPKIPLIRNQTRLNHAFRECVKRLRSRAQKSGARATA